MWAQPSTPMAPPITVPSVQNAMVRTPLTVPPAASTPERSRSCSRSRVQSSSKNVLRRSSGSRGSNDSPTVSGAVIVIETSCKGRISGRSVLPEGERHIVPTESERIVDRVVVVAGSRRTGHDVEVDLRVQILQVERRRDATVAEREHRQNGVDGTDCADRMAQRTLGCEYRRLVAAHRIVDRLAFGDVAAAGAGGVRVPPIGVGRRKAGQLDGTRHRVARLLTV